MVVPPCNFSSFSPFSNRPNEYADIVWWTNSVCLPIIAVLGIACNLLNICILTVNRAARRIPSWSLLVALAICDSFFLVFAVLETTPLGVPAITLWPLMNKMYVHSALYVRTLASTFYKSSVLIVLAFNIERYVYVVCPLRSRRICTPKWTRLAIAGSLIISLLCSLQFPLCYRIHVCEHELSHSFIHVILMKDNASLQMYYRVMDYLSLFGFNVLPVAALLVMNSRLILTLKRVATEDDAKRKEGSLVQQEPGGSRVSANAMLFAVVVVLLLCLGPQAPGRLLFTYLGQYHPTAILYTCISQQLVFLNASLNFAMYCVVSRRYRSLMSSTFRHLRRGQTDIRTRTSKHSSGHGTSLFDPAIPLQPRGSGQGQALLTF